MWICDLEQAVKDLKPFYNMSVFDKVVPFGSGIMFYTTHFTKVLWKPDACEIYEYTEDNKKVLHIYTKLLTNN